MQENDVNKLIEILLFLWTIIKEVLPSICTIVVALISSRMVIKSSNKAAKKEEANRLQNKLENFYFPFLLLSKKTTQLYNGFYKIWGKEYNSCLDFLLDNQQFQGNSLVLFKEIIDNNRMLNDLIIKYSALISNANLRNDLSKLSAHYTLLELSYEQKLVGNQEVLKEYVFPENVVKNVEDEITRILQCIDELNK
ncbi:hypothetical protein RBG61_13095 [Paludicola sp. MB14-C6]|uniref:hypothetical protein n=1 Tax=Paludihabitans sp. MB14-C6 TaxID=3070656 RepID=UPI0027DD7B36|nr:hypothetical protein [Paludicola sp. MB14-C6]WMJ22910.1 hypothetical protein RBG61_13095 [Paludicola sp. MB14-C6]